jgi:RNA-directed DNA polymerase
MNLIEPPLDRTFIHDSYACRRGKGVHAAVDRS